MNRESRPRLPRRSRAGRDAVESAAGPRRRLSRAEPGCFTDEIAIDFPSVGGAVQRMRDALLDRDDHPRILQSAVYLSPLEAFTGAVVPLDVPVPGICRACGGRGESWAERCEPCEGSGEALFRHRVRLVVPPRSRDGVCLRLRVSRPDVSPVHVDVRVSVAAAGSARSVPSRPVPEIYDETT